MDCVACGSAAVAERPERTTRGYHRFRCRECGKQYNERSGGRLNHAQYPSDMIALVVLWRLRYRLTLRDLAEMFLIRGIAFSYEAVRDWEAKLAPVLAGALRQRRHGRSGARGRRWHVDEMGYPVLGGRSLYWWMHAEESRLRGGQRSVSICPSSGGGRHALLWTGRIPEADRSVCCGQ
jgi:hypothetical protein